MSLEYELYRSFLSAVNTSPEGHVVGGDAIVGLTLSSSRKFPDLQDVNLRKNPILYGLHEALDDVIF